MPVSRRSSKTPRKNRTIPSLRALATLVERSHTAVATWLRHPAWEWERVPPWSPDDVEAMKVWAAAVLKPDRSDPDAIADPLMVAGGNSPALERYRAARADMAELERDRIRGDLVRVAVIMETLRPFLTVLRRAGEQLRLKCGNDAVEIFNDSIQAASDHVAKLIEGRHAIEVDEHGD